MGGALLADVNAFGVGRGEVEERFGGEMVVEDDVGLGEEAAAFEGEKLGISGAGANEVRPAVHAEYTASRIRFAPRSRRAAPRARPRASASAAGPSASARISSEPSGEATTPSRWSFPFSMRAWAPIGTWQP